MPTLQGPSRFRLPAGVRPVRYDLHLEPDLDAGTFRGTVQVQVTVATATRTIVLHAADMTIDRASVTQEGAPLTARVRLDRYDETATLTFGRDVTPGTATITLAYHAPFNQHLRGFYAARANGRPYAFTQCEAAEARRVLPCFDEPAFKARFRVAVTARAGDAVVGNAPIEREERVRGGRIVRFAETPPLSTYLLAVAVGPMEASEVRQCGSTPIRVWHVPGKGHMTAFALEAAAESLRRLEDYFGIPYPYGKLDLVAAPDFEAGAMENAGAVFFRETLLLLDPATVSLPERKRAAEVIAHELAHMWYGDLVTMAWWDDLWLNEAFATWMAYRVIADWKPDWRMWEGFEHDRAGALGLDALANTHPIYAPVHSVAQATENFDLITYEKGAAVVRMIEHYLGADGFRDGVRRYMQRHREGNAVADDLWRALGESTNQDVASVAHTWIAQPGFPVVTFASGTRGTRVRQERFFADPKVSDARRKTAWPVPLVIKSSAGITRTLMTKASAAVDVGTGWYFGNAGAGGFYRVRHAREARARLIENLGLVLSPVERLAFLGDEWALVRAGRSRIEDFLDVAEALGGERDHDVLDGLAGSLALIDEQLAHRGPLARAYRAWIVEQFGAAFARAGWTPGAGEDDDARLRRAALLRIVGGLAEDPAVLRASEERFERYLVDRAAVDPNLAETVVGLAARVGDEARWERFLNVAAEARTPQERRRFLLHLGSFRSPACVERTLQALLGGDIPTQDVAFVLMRLLGNPAGKEAAWQFVVKRWRALRKRIPPLMLSRLIEVTPALREPRYAREVRVFFTAHPVAEATRALKQALEVFRLNAELRRRTAPGFARWVAQHAPRGR